jgi:chromosome segregation ATPase
LGQPIVELRKNQAALSVLINRLFADLDLRRTQLDGEARELQSQREHLSRQNSAQAAVDGALAVQCQERLAQAEAELSVARREIAEYRERFSAAAAAQNPPCDPGSNAPDHPLRLKELELERAELQRSLDAARAQISQLAGAALELAEARAQLACLRERLLEAQAQAQSAGNACETDRQQQICDLELERRTLRAELETVRRQAAELADHLAESRRQFVEERSEWNAELRHLRRLLERQSQLMEDRNVFGMYGNSAPRGSQTLDPVNPNHDPVLGAVMAQFAQLKHDRQIREPATNSSFDAKKG